MCIINFITSKVFLTSSFSFLMTSVYCQDITTCCVHDVQWSWQLVSYINNLESVLKGHGMYGNVAVSFLRGVVYAFWSFEFWYHSVSVETMKMKGCMWPTFYSVSIVGQVSCLTDLTCFTTLLMYNWTKTKLVLNIINLKSIILSIISTVIHS